MLHVLISFDTEDFVTPQADDAAKYYAETLTHYGVRGTFFIVGEVLRVLKQRKRLDVLSAMARHDIGYHSNTHSLSPMINEYQNSLPWHQAVDELVCRESDGICELAQTFERPIVSLCPPGINYSACMLAGFSRLGIDICSGFSIDGGNGCPAFYTGIVNLGYDRPDMFMSESRALTALPRLNDLYNARASLKRYAAIFTHSNMLITEQAWDAYNLRTDTSLNRALLKPAPLKSPREVNGIKRCFEDFLGNAVKYKDMEFITYSDLKSIAESQRHQLVSKNVIETLARSVLREFTYHEVGGIMFSPAEIFVILGTYTLALLEGYPWSDRTMPQVIGPIASCENTQHVARIKVSQLRIILKSIFEKGDIHEIPGVINFNDTQCNPSWLLGACAGLIAAGHLNSYNDLNDIQINIPELKPLPSIAYTDLFEKFTYRSSMGICPSDFTGENLINTNLLQTWSYKPSMA